MTIIISYKVDNDLYLSPNTNRNPALITTEYMHKNNMLIHTQMSKNTAIRVNNILESTFRVKSSLDNNLYFSRKTYSKNDANPITKGSFEERLSKFPKDETKITKEILEQYDYCGKDGNSDKVKIVINQNEGEIIAVIDFNSIQQYENFIAPNWLSKYEE